MTDHPAALRAALDAARDACASMGTGTAEEVEAVSRSITTLAMVATLSGREVLDELDRMKAALAARWGQPALDPAVSERLGEIIERSKEP